MSTNRTLKRLINYSNNMDVLNQTIQKLIDLKDEVFLQVVNQVLNSSYKKDEVDPEILKDFKLIDDPISGSTAITYKGVYIGLITKMDLPKLGFEFNPAF